VWGRRYVCFSEKPSVRRKRLGIYVLKQKNRNHSPKKTEAPKRLVGLAQRGRAALKKKGGLLGKRDAAELFAGG